MDNQLPPVDSSDEEVKGLQTKVGKFLSTVERYNVDNLPVFEKYVEFQLSHWFYDLDANLAVLKLYQLFPQFYKHDVVYKILSKALTNLPRNDFDLCRCLLGGEQFGDLSIQRLCNVANLLEGDGEGSQYFFGVFGVDDEIRRFISRMVSIMYKNIKETELKAFLGNIDDHKLQKWMQAFNWEKGVDGVVKICNQEDRVIDKDIAEKFNLKTMSTLIDVARKTGSLNETAVPGMSSRRRANSFTENAESSEPGSCSVDPDPNHDPDVCEGRTYDLSRKPSQETEFYWIQVWNRSPYNSKHATEDEDETVVGKWLIFEPLYKIDETCNRISTAVANGLLGTSAKVSTMKDNEVRSPNTDQAVICVYTYDHNDEDDVMRVRGALRRMGFTRKLPYKTDMATLEGKYRWNTGKGKRVSKYYL